MLAEAIPGFEELQPGQTISVNDSSENPAYKIISEPIPPIDEIIHRKAFGELFNDSILALIPDPHIKMMAVDLLSRAIKLTPSLYIENEEINSFPVYVVDMKDKEIHQLSVNHAHQKAEHECIKAGKFEGENVSVKYTQFLFAHQDTLLGKKDFFNMIQSEEFKAAFASLGTGEREIS